MSPERRLSRGTRVSVRRRKADLHRELGITRPHVDSSSWPTIEGILKDIIPDYEENYAHHSSVLREFSEIRQRVTTGESLTLITEFSRKYNARDPALLKHLGPVLSKITKLSILKR